MKVFISWSGHRAHLVADKLHEWLPLVINSVEPFLSSHGIMPGHRSINELTEALENAGAAIVCLTPENLDSPWINYEVGFMSAKMSTPICTLLIGVSDRNVNGPLSQFQHTSIKNEDMQKLLISINSTVKRNGERGLEQNTLLKSFNTHWPELYRELQEITLSSRTEISGIWEIDYDKNSRYYIKQIGNYVWWLGEQKNDDPQWCNVAYGRIHEKRKELELNWCDVPKGKAISNGSLVLKIVDDDTLEFITGTGGHAAKKWKRIHKICKPLS